MTIKTLTVENFAGIESAVLVFDKPVVLVTGDNAAGKSSVRDAILWALTGLTKDISKKNESRLLAHNGGKIRVTVECDDGWKFSRTEKTCSAQDGELRRRFGDPAVVRACMDAFEIMERTPRERMELVKAVGSSGEALTAAFNERAAEHIGETGLQPGAVEPILDYLGAGNVDKAEAVAVEGRRAAKRKLEELPQETPPSKLTIAGKEIDLTAGTMDQMRAFLKKLEGERDEAVRAEGASRLLDLPEAIERDIKAAEAKLSKLAVAANPAEVQNLQAEYKAACAERDKAGQAVGEAKARYDMARKRYAEAEKLKDKCPTCAKPMSKADLAQLLQTIQAEGNAAGQAKEDAEVAQVQAGAQATQVNARLESIKRDGLEASGLEVEIGSLRTRMAESQGHETVEGRAEELAARIEVGRQVIVAKGAYEAAGLAVAQRAGIEAEAQHWDALAHVLGPDGPVRKAATQGFKLAEVLAHARMLLGETVKVEVSPDWTITMNGRVRLSRSERWRLGACFAAAMAESAGLTMLALDEADILRGQAQAAAVGWLESLAGQFGRVLVCATGDGAPPAVPWLQTFHVTDGRVERVAADTEVVR